MNLALNARDAMPEGGKLTIETANAQLDADYARRHLGVASGAYVAVTVSDTGSEPGHGTTFRVYLPRTTETADLAAADGRGGRPAAGSQTVLLVEDEAGVRRLVRMILEQSGRTVIDTGDAHEALDLARRHPGAIDLLITDMVMPGLSGRDVAARIRAYSPDTRVLYMSGYTGDAMIHRGLLRPGAVFLVKPFTADELLDKVRTILERPAREEA